ncbi:MAG TPA: hypothetical protein VMM13_11390 [Euzebya sp.]|nr:hypothetical protein [Euzebya sp.]
MDDLLDVGEYDVTIRREGGAWLAEFPGVPGCHTYARTLRELLNTQLRDALSLFASDADTAALVVELPDAIHNAAAMAQGALVEVGNAELHRRYEVVRAAKTMRAAGVSLRDIGEVVGYSHARIRQLLDAADAGQLHLEVDAPGIQFRVRPYQDVLSATATA